MKNKINNHRFMALFLAVFLTLGLVFAPIANAAYTTFNCDTLTGGASRALDSHAVGDLTTGDRAICAISGELLYFVYDSTATAAENVATHPYVVRPDDYSTGGNWEEQVWGGGTDTLSITAAAELTISGGAVTKTQTLHRIDTESDAASDDLTTINGGTDGDVFIGRAEHTDRTAVFKHGTGNIELNGADITLDDTDLFVILIYDATLSKWVLAGGGAGGDVAADAIWDGAGDLVQGTGANTAEKLAIGAANLKLFVNAAGNSAEWEDGLNIVNTTRDMTAATGDVQVAGAGFKPGLTIVTAAISGVTTGSWGCVISPTKETCMGLYPDAGGDPVFTNDTNNTILLYGAEGVLGQTALTKSIDADGLTLTFTKTGSPTGTAHLKFIFIR